MSMGTQVICKVAEPDPGMLGKSGFGFMLDSDPASP